MRNVRFIFITLACVLLLGGVVGAFVYAVDPLQHYRKAAYEPLFSGQQRYQNPGLARNYAYDTIIIGSSMTENFIPSEVGAKLGGRVLKLSIEGSTAKEQRMIADIAIGTGQVKKVLWGLDYFSLREDSVQDAATFPFYLYDDNKLNDYKYIYNISNIKHALGAMLLPKDMYLKYRSLETLNNWDRDSVYGPKAVMNKWRQAWSLEQTSAEYEPSLDVVKQRFHEHILSLVEAHPEIEFIVYYPPYSIIRQQVWNSLNPERFANQLAMRTYMFEQFSGYDNVTIHDFQSDGSITYDLGVYKDLSHHTGGINSRIIDEIAAGTHLVTAGNVNETNSLLERQVQSLIINENGAVFSLSITVNGQTAAISPNPTTMSDQVLVPLKEFAQATGIAFDYDMDSKQATLAKGGNVLVLETDNPVASLNGAQVNLDTPAAVVKTRLSVPIVQVAELLGGNVAITKDEAHPYFVNYDISF